MFIPKIKFVKRLLFFIVLMMFFMVIWVIVKDSENFTNCWAEKQINCGDDDSLQTVYLLEDEPSINTRSIMLLEGHFNDHLSPRMLCTIESAAVAHPSIVINVMMTSQTLKLTPVTKRVISKYGNVKVFYLNTTKLSADSPFKEWILQKKWKESSWPKSHFNDVIRWILLWKYGGIYLDMDVIILRNIMEDENFSALESDRWVGAGALGFTPKHSLIEECLMSMIKNYDGKVWGSGGPELLTNTLIEKCGMELPSGELKSCPDIKIYSTKSFYPIPWWEWHTYLEENAALSKTLFQDPEILGLHVWNFHLHNYPIKLQESSPYAVAARNACKEVVDEVGSQF